MSGTSKVWTRHGMKLALHKPHRHQANQKYLPIPFNLREGIQASIKTSPTSGATQASTDRQTIQSLIQTSTNRRLETLAMCRPNSASSICGHDIAGYLARGKNRPVVHFCYEIRGMALQAILALVDQDPRQAAAGKTCNYAATLVQDGSRFRSLVAACHLGFSHDRVHADVWKRLAMPAFRNLVKWVERKAVAFGAIAERANMYVCGQRFADP